MLQSIQLLALDLRLIRMHLIHFIRNDFYIFFVFFYLYEDCCLLHMHCIFCDCLWGISSLLLKLIYFRWWSPDLSKPIPSPHLKICCFDSSCYVIGGSIRALTSRSRVTNLRALGKDRNGPSSTYLPEFPQILPTVQLAQWCSSTLLKIKVPKGELSWKNHVWVLQRTFQWLVWTFFPSVKNIRIM